MTIINHHALTVNDVQLYVRNDDLFEVGAPARVADGAVMYLSLVTPLLTCMDARFAQRAGPALQDVLLSAYTRNGPLEPGQGLTTPGFALRAAHVFHLVGPALTRTTSERSESAVLRQGLLGSFYAANARDCVELALEPIPFPAAGAGGLLDRLEAFVDVLVGALRAFNDPPVDLGLKRVTLVVPSYDDVRRVMAAVARLQQVPAHIPA